MNWADAYRIIIMGITITIVFLHSVCSSQPQMPLQPMPPPALYSPNGVSLNISFAQAFASNWLQGDGENMLNLKVLSRSIDDRMVGPFKLKSTMQFALGANYRDDSIKEN